MKYIFLSLIIFYSIPYCFSEVDCRKESYIEKMAKEIGVPNCLKKEVLDVSRSTNFCSGCASDFNMKYTGNIPQLTLPESQKLFFDSTFKEFKKNITNNLIEAAKLSALPPTGAAFDSSLKSCKWKSSEEFIKGCKSTAAQKLFQNPELFNKLNQEVSSEIAKILSSDDSFKPKSTLLNRTAPQCFIPEKELLYLASATIEEAFTPKMIEELSKLNPSKFKTIDSIFESTAITDAFEEEKDIMDLKVSIKSHPFLNQIFQDPKSVIDFFKNIKRPLNINSIKEAIYTKATGESVDKKLAKSCEESFQSFKDAVCSTDFEEGKFNLDPLQSFSKIYDKNLETSEEELSNTDLLIKQNIDLVRLCERENPSNKLSLKDQNETISKNLPANYKNQSLKLFTTDKYVRELGLVNDEICKIKKEKSCVGDSLFCKMFQKYNNIQNPNTLDAKLAKSSNKELNSLIRSMIGTLPKDTDPKTKEILISAGIIPKDDGTIVAQPDIPERRPDYFSKAASAPAPQIAQAQPAPTGSQAAPSHRADNQFYDQDFSEFNQSPQAASSVAPDISDVVQNQNELRNIQDEIRRRLTNLKQPVTPEATKKAISDSFRARGQSITPAQTETIYERVMPEVQSQPTTVASAPLIAPATDGSARVSGGPSAQQRRQEEQRNAALMGMAGARSLMAAENAGREPASVENKPKDLTKVALNLPDDPQISLSEIFNRKLGQNDPETQLLKVLLRSKNNFMLQVKSVNFRIIFSENNKFNVLLDSGDKKEAEKLRPQLEMFLKKLKV